MRHSRFPGSRTFRARSSHRFAFARYSRFFVGIAHEPTFPNGPHQSEADSISSKVKSPTLGYLINQLLCGHGQPGSRARQGAQVVQAQLSHVAERHRRVGPGDRHRSLIPTYNRPDQPRLVSLTS